jgi:hypothetical protein
MGISGFVCMSAFLLHKSLGGVGDKSPNELRWKILSLAFDMPWCNVDHINNSYNGISIGNIPKCTRAGTTQRSSLLLLPWLLPTVRSQHRQPQLKPIEVDSKVLSCG